MSGTGKTSAVRQDVGLILSSSASDCTWELVDIDTFNKCKDCYDEDRVCSSSAWESEFMEELYDILGEWDQARGMKENVLKMFFTQSFAYEDTKFLTEYNIVGIIPIPEC